MPVPDDRQPELRQRLHYHPGSNPAILVGAPHHGYQHGCDFYTGEFASILSAPLGAALLIADGLRPLVDLNKEPHLAATQELRSLCLTYQEHALAAPVSLFVEIHGHVHGQYGLELSCGFHPEPAFPLDKELVEMLSLLRTSLDKEIGGRWRSWFPLPAPSVGIFPFDRQVVMKATKTFLFQRIRSLQLQGRRIFGLHIEVYRDYKTGDAGSPYAVCQRALAEALAAGIKASFGV